MSSETSATISSCACGKTARNHPTQPASARAAPRTLTDMLVTSPAKSRVAPKARMKGQAVGAGTSIVWGVGKVSFNCSVVDIVAISTSAAENVNYGKDHNPYGI